MVESRKSVTIILDLTDKCNFGCKYCFEGQFLDAGEGEKEINEKLTANLGNVASLVKQTMEWNGGKKIRILLHGGEPLLINPDTYQELFREVEMTGAEPRYMLQTNASLATKEHSDLFKKYGVRVGTSIDGYSPLHDSQRVYKNGAGTFDSVWRGVERMRDSGLNPGAMATITSNTIRDPEGFYLFFAEKGIDLQFNPIFKAEVQAEENSIYITPKQYSDFCCKVFDLWIDDQKNLTNIYNFATIAQAFFRHEKIVPTCTFNENCFDAFVTMDTGGDLYHCHRTVGNKDMCSGNIASMDMTEFMHDGEFMKNRAGLLKASSCYGCDNFSYCYGGCPYNAYLYKGSFFEKDYFCYAYQTVNHHIYDYLKDHERK